MHVNVVLEAKFKSIDEVRICAIDLSASFTPEDFMKTINDQVQLSSLDVCVLG